MTTLLRCLFALLITLTITQPATASNRVCDQFWVTGYVSGPDAPNPTTADGTPIGTDEPIAAAPGWVPFGTLIEIPDLGTTYRVADRGGLGSCDLDIHTWSRAEAYALTGYHRATITRWGY